ncbi:MAG: amidohydrolase [Bacillota bacterium]
MILINNFEEIYGSNHHTEDIKNGYILIEGDKIEKIGSINDRDYDIIKKREGINFIDATDMIVLPGLINTHTHAGMNLLRGYADDYNLQTWLEEKIWPFEGRMNEEDIYWGTKLAIIEMIKNGVTTFNDMYFATDRVVSAVKESGIRAVLGYGLIEDNDGEEGLQESIRLIEMYDGYLNGRIKINLAPHAPYTCSNEYLEEVMKIADKYNSIIHIHVAETEVEVNDMIEKIGKTPVEYLKDLGLFDFHTLAAHGVHLKDNDIEILAENNVHIAHNPASNMKLGSGVIRLNDLLKSGINVSLGTDGVASNNGLDLIHDARLAAYLQKAVNNDPTIITLEELLKMVTINGAKALGFSDIGCLEEGKKADITLINTDKNPAYTPDYNSLSNIFYAGSGRDVDTVIIDGEIILENSKLNTIDEEEVYSEVSNRMQRLSE